MRKVDAKQQEKVEDIIVHLKLAVCLETGIYNDIMSSEKLKKELLKPLKMVELTPEIEKACDYFEHALLSGHHLAYRELMSQKNTKEIIIPLLEKAAQWNGKNDEIFIPIINEFKNTIEKGALSEIGKKASTFWKVGGIAAVFIGGICAIGIKHLRDKKKSAKK